MNMEARTPAAQRNQRKVRIGKVISNKMQKSIVVSLERKIPHPLYKKYHKLTSTLTAHDEKQEASIGDLVKVMETRRLSKTTRWRLVAIIEKAK